MSIIDSEPFVVDKNLGEKLQLSPGDLPATNADGESVPESQAPLPGGATLWLRSAPPTNGQRPARDRQRHETYYFGDAPGFVPGVRLETIQDDGSAGFEDLFRRCDEGPVISESG